MHAPLVLHNIVLHAAELLLRGEKLPFRCKLFQTRISFFKVLLRKKAVESAE